MANLVAQTGCSFLFEYEMPSGKIYLHQVDIKDDGTFSEFGKSVSKRNLPEKWKSAEWFEDWSPKND